MVELTHIGFNEANYKMLLTLVGQQSEEIAILKDRIKDLEAQLGKNSQNSSTPPSSDGLKKKAVNLRKPSGKSAGGQLGHKGTTLQFEGSVDKVVYHLPDQICNCGDAHMEERETKYYEIDLPELKTEVILHKKMSYHCKKCGKVYSSSQSNRGPKVQYGPHIKSLALYLKDYHFIPYQRLSEFFNDCFSLTISKGTLSNFTTKAHHHLERFEEKVKSKLIVAPVLHADETGMRAQGKTQWMHVSSNDALTYYHFDEKRGTEAIERAGVIACYQGTLVHDRFASYFNYPATHSLCNAHILRELIFLEEQGYQWAKEIKTILLKAKEKKESGLLHKAYITRIRKQYKKIIRDELSKLPTDKSNRSRGRPKRTKSDNLLIALNKYSRQVLRFTSDQQVPFDNNLAERDIRMVKTKQKVSGCFRSQEGGQYFARIRSYISTMKKQKRNVLQGFKQVFEQNLNLSWIAEQ